MAAEMRFKATDGPIDVHHNGNHHLNRRSLNRTSGDNTRNVQDISPTRDTLTNTNLTLHGNTDDITTWSYSNDQIINSNLVVQHQNDHNQLQKNNLLRNINNNLAAALQEHERIALHHHHHHHQHQLQQKRLPRRNVTSSSICSAESSPDDSFLEYEEAHQSCSSIDTSPQGDEEDRCFELSDSESCSDDGNLSGNSHVGNPIRTRGIVNPNYPGFQHLAHTLEYSIKSHISDTDLTDDDLDGDPILPIDENSINNNNNSNNNNNEDDVEFKIDSVNRLDSVENIQKVFYDKPKFSIPLECDTEKRINYVVDLSENANTSVNVDLENSVADTAKVSNVDTAVELSDSLQAEESNIPTCDLPGNNDVPVVSSCDEELNNIEIPLTPLNHPDEEVERLSASTDDIIGDFGKEVEQEIGRIVARNIEFEKLEQAVDKLSIAEKQQRKQEVVRYNIEPVQPVPTIGDDIVKVIGSECEVANSNSKVCEPNCKVVETISAEMTAVTIPKPVSVLSGPVAIQAKMVDAFLSDTREDLVDVKVVEKEKRTIEDSNRENEERSAKMVMMEKPMLVEKHADDIEKFSKEEQRKHEKEKDEDSGVPRKKEKMEINYNVKKNQYHNHRRDGHQQVASIIPIQRRELSGRSRESTAANRRSLPAAVRPEKKRTSPEVFGGFDVYNIETAMPKIDLDAIESHLKAAREEERRRRTDREEIRRRLAMGSEADEYYTPGDRPGRKPSLQARLQSGMNLQICFMNETVSDSESPSSDTESSTIPSGSMSLDSKTNIARTPPYQKTCSAVNDRPRFPNISTPTIQNGQRPLSLSINQSRPMFQSLSEPVTEADFFARQARLQIEARMALAQAKEMAHMQMEVERQRQKKSPITEIVRTSLEKVGIQFPEERRRVSRQILTEMNVAQLQVIVNDLHTQIETLNENLVRFLMDRDDLHMEQDSMLVDIEDLTRYLGAKEQNFKEQKLKTPQTNSIPSPLPTSLMALSSSVKPRLNRIANLVKK